MFHFSAGETTITKLTLWKKPHAFSVNVNHINTHSTKPDKKASYVLHNY